MREGGPQDMSRPHQPGGPLPLLPRWPHGGPGSQGLESGRNPAPQVASGVGECPSGQPDSGFLGPRPSPVPLPHRPAKAIPRAIPASRTPNRLAAGLAALPVAAAVAPQQPRVGTPVCQGSLRPRACGAAQDTEPTDSLHAWPAPARSLASAPALLPRGGEPRRARVAAASPPDPSLGAAARLPRSHLLPPQPLGPGS